MTKEELKTIIKEGHGKLDSEGKDHLNDLLNGLLEGKVAINDRVLHLHDHDIVEQFGKIFDVLETDRKIGEFDLGID